jgi:hypothetical protein
LTFEIPYRYAECVKRFFVVALFALACGGGGIMGGSGTPVPGAVPFYNPAVFAEAWTTMESCSGLTGDLSKVSFFTAPHITVGGQDFSGYWFQATNQIVVLDSVKANQNLIYHEMMHALLQRGDHPTQYFNGSCGDLMAVPHLY